MMPDLGKYAEAVLSSYAISLGLIVALVVLSILRDRKVKAQLAEVEARGKTGGKAQEQADG
ncbi:MAG: heme exporter protein CcmD [Pseudomonadota bacterium]|jgi:heme exporter protein D|nr:heme exporter protein CcmD [Pseudomonadota bacterium]